MINTETKTQLISHDVGGSLRHLHRILISLPEASVSTQPMSKSDREKHARGRSKRRSEAAFPPTAELRSISSSAGVPFFGKKKQKKNIRCS